MSLYPSPYVRAEGLQRVYLAAYLGGLATVLAAIYSWWSSEAAKAGPEHAVLLLLGLVDIARIVPFYGSALSVG